MQEARGSSFAPGDGVATAERGRRENLRKNTVGPFSHPKRKA